MFNILCTGNPNYLGIPMAVKNKYSNTVFAHLSNGWDLTDFEKFKKEIANFNVFINHSSFNSTIQSQLLVIAANVWKENNIKGNIFNIGSVIEYDFLRNHDKLYHAQKTSLKNLSIDLCSENIKTTHFIIGGVKTRYSYHTDKLECKHIVEMIDYILKFPYHIPLISVEKILDIHNAERRCLK
jgi:hypothetical protein